jgi:hypothetical protein
VSSPTVVASQDSTTASDSWFGDKYKGRLAMQEADESFRDPLKAGHTGLAWLTYGPLGDFTFRGVFGPDLDENRETMGRFLATGRDDLWAFVYKYSRRHTNAKRQSASGTTPMAILRALHEQELAGDALSFLNSVPGLRGLGLWSPHPGNRTGAVLDLGPLYNLKKLKALDVSSFDHNLEWTRLAHLKELKLRQFYWSRVESIGCLSELERLALHGYKPRGKGPSDLPAFPKLHTLGLQGSSLQVLTGLDRFPQLDTLVVSDLNRPGLKHLTIHGSRQLGDHQLAVYLPNLEYLELSKCGTIESLDFLDDMPNLRHFNFCGTGVRDGNLRPLFRLTSARFWPRRNFSHTHRQIEDINREVHGMG